MGRWKRLLGCGGARRTLSVETAAGAARWSGSAIVQPPALAYGTSLVPTTSGRPLAIDAAHGAVAAYDAQCCDAGTCGELWSEATGGRITGALAVSLGKVFVGTEKGT